MPLDGTTYKQKIKPLETGLAGMRQCEEALRYIPPYWEWCFWDLGEDHECGSHGCAIGLFRRLWPQQIKMASTRAVANAIHISRDELAPIFGTSGLDGQMAIYGKKTMHDITPTDVADAIDEYIERKEAEERAA